MEKYILFVLHIKWLAGNCGGGNLLFVLCAKLLCAIRSFAAAAAVVVVRGLLLLYVHHENGFPIV